MRERSTSIGVMVLLPSKAIRFFGWLLPGKLDVDLHWPVGPGQPAESCGIRVTGALTTPNGWNERAPCRNKTDVPGELAHTRHNIVRATPLFSALTAQLTEEIRVEAPRVA